MLTEIHRQAGESAIIRLATMARQGIEIPPGRHDEHVWKLPRNAVGPAQMLRGGQVICGRNNTRLWLNASITAGFGAGGWLPTGPGEKIICLKNRHDLGLINGMFLSLTDVRPDAHDAYAFSAMVETEDGTAIGGRQSFWRGEYADHIAFDPERGRREWQIRRGLIETSWGYAITCHKAQGSQWDKVVLFDESYAFREDGARWLYTGVTRAAESLTLVR
jgi:exodeoxyribonuclease-5